MKIRETLEAVIEVLKKTPGSQRLIIDRNLLLSATRMLVAHAVNERISQSFYPTFPPDGASITVEEWMIPYRATDPPVNSRMAG